MVGKKFMRWAVRKIPALTDHINTLRTYIRTYILWKPKLKGNKISS